MKPLNVLLAETAALHPHLCPRQVLGVRIGMLAGRLLNLDLPQADKRMFTIVETDGCFSDGIAVATGCRVGRRTLRIEDYGKVAATFVDTTTGSALRINPRREARDLAREYAPEARDQWEAMLLGYQRMPDEVLFCIAPVTLTLALERIISRPGLRAICALCGEEIMNGREVILDGRGLCASCAGNSYYTSPRDAAPAVI
ncbi:MAG: FmdE family protein [Rudaea sp.]